MRGNRVHQHRRWVGSFAARHVNANTVKGRYLLTQQAAVFITVAPTFAVGLLLCLVIRAYPLGGGNQCITLCRGYRLKGGFEFSLSQFKRAHGGNFKPVKTRGVVQ